MYNCFFKRLMVDSFLLLLFVPISICSFALINSFSTCLCFNSKRAILEKKKDDNDK